MLFKSTNFIWPFTLNYPFNQTDCINCHNWTKPFEALWQFPLHEWTFPNGKKLSGSLYNNHWKVRMLAKSLGATAEPPDLGFGPQPRPGLVPELAPKLGTWADNRIALTPSPVLSPRPSSGPELYFQGQEPVRFRRENWLLVKSPVGR
jgi:hypothetical protein